MVLWKFTDVSERPASVGRYFEANVCIFELRSWGSSVVIMLGLRDGRTGVRIPDGARDFRFFKG